MAKIKALADIATKWTRVTPGRTQDFREGISAPRKDWASQTSAAEGAYTEGVTKAASEGRFGKGVKARGTAGWQEKTLTKGVNRWGEGVRGATQDFQNGFAPFHKVVESTTLPPRGAKGDPRNIDRVAAIANALHSRKVNA